MENKKVNVSQELLKLLELSIGELTPYIEESVLDNPFIELNYSKEVQVASHRYDDTQRQGVDPQMPEPPQTLPVFLFEQIMMYRETPIRDTMVRLVDYIDERGYIPHTYQELSDKLGLPAMLVLDALTLIKQLEPSGVGAYDLRECWMLQTEQDRTAPNVAYYLLEEFFDLLANHDYDAIVQQSSLTHEEIEESVHYFQTLRAVPATLFEQRTSSNLLSEVTFDDATSESGVYNRHYYPELVFNQAYYDKMYHLNDPEVTAYILPHDTGYRQLVSLLSQREQCVLQVANAIWHKQHEYLTGKTPTKAPLLVKDIAQKTGLPEPIVNVIVTNKGLEYQRRVYPLRDFITVATHVGRGGLTASHVKDLIIQLIQSSSTPLSDADIVAQLATHNVMISEKMVANYRTMPHSS